MVDVLKSHVQDVMSVIRVPGLNPNSNDENLTLSGTQRLATHKQRQTTFTRKRENEVSIKI